jgi:hypothetical protein
MEALHVIALICPTFLRVSQSTISHRASQTFFK